MVLFFYGTAMFCLFLGRKMAHWCRRLQITGWILDKMNKAAVLICTKSVSGDDDKKPEGTPVSLTASTQIEFED